MENYLSCYWKPQKKAGVAILISDKLDFKLKAVTRDEEGHYIIIIGSIHQEELTIINVCAPNTGALKYIKQLITNISNLIDKNVVIAGGFNTPLTTMERSSRHRINKETRALNDTLDQMELTDIFKLCIPKQQNILSTRVHMEPSPRQITYWVTQQPFISIQELRSYHAHFQITMPCYLKSTTGKSLENLQKHEG